MKICSKCNQSKPHEAFSKSKARADGLQGICKDCMKALRKAHYVANKEELVAKVVARRQAMTDKLWAYKQGKKCADCPQTDPRTFEFDHISDDKEHNISAMVKDGFSWAKIEAEIAKCEIVCASCHRIRTHESGGWVRNIVVQA